MLALLKCNVRSDSEPHCSVCQRPLLAVSSTDRCNTFCELLSRRLIEQGLSRPFIELPCDSTELGLTVQGQIGATRKILAQQSVGFRRMCRGPDTSAGAFGKSCARTWSNNKSQHSLEMQN